ncbi:MAG: hypothetical protein KIS67_15100 [Verrucomicrobiae bacterium]|nr:hypothetical protein [Verrucomicrobiae bacterium]
MKKSVVGLAVAVFIGAGYPQARAAVLVQYDFTGNSDVASTVHANTTATDFFAGPGITVGFSANGNPAPSRSVDASTTGATQDDNDGFGFTLTADSGFLLNLNTFTLTFDALNVDSSVGNQTANWAVRTSVLGFAVNIGTGTFDENGTAVSMTFTGAEYDGLTSIEVRLYMWDPNGSQEMLFDNVTLNGAVSVIPEPVNVALGVFGLCAVGFAVGRRYLRKRV